jgi:hypothetical protein
MGASDYELIDGIPRWVWDLDDECARMAAVGEDQLTVIPKIVEMARTRRGVSKAQVATWLQECRVQRTKTVIDMSDGEKPRKLYVIRGRG